MDVQLTHYASASGTCFRAHPVFIGCVQDALSQLKAAKTRVGVWTSWSLCVGRVLVVGSCCCCCLLVAIVAVVVFWLLMLFVSLIVVWLFWVLIWFGCFCVCVCVCVWERERERESVCWGGCVLYDLLYASDSVGGNVCVCVCVWEREWMNEWMNEWINFILFYEGSGVDTGSFYIQPSPMRD